MRSLYWKMPVNNPMDLLKFNLLFAHIYFCSDVYNIFVSFFYITFFLVFYLRIFADLLHFLINVQPKNWFVCSTNYLRGKQFLLYLFSLSFSLSLFIIHSIYVTWNWFFSRRLLHWMESPFWNELKRTTQLSKLMFQSYILRLKINNKRWQKSILLFIFFIFLFSKINWMKILNEITRGKKSLSRICYRGPI